MQFIYQPLTWGFLLVLLPVLIHLINLMRHKRVKWAAMEFLLQSYKKHRRWVWLKQFLLLMARMLAIAVAVAMLARLVTSDQWSFLFGGQATHHYVVLDDSLSMSDRGGTTTAFDRAQRVIGRIGARVADHDSDQLITLIHYSQTSLPAEGGQSPSALNAAPVGSDFEDQLEQWRRVREVTQLDVGPAEALELVHGLVEGTPDEYPIVYLVSDFRDSSWSNPAQWREAFRGLRGLGADVHLVRCVAEQHQNLAIEELVPAGGTQAAGVPLPIDVRVKNFGPQTAQRVQIRVTTRAFASSSAAVAADGVAEALPSLVIDQIAPGETATRQFQVRFLTPGQHVVEAALEGDAIEADNHRWLVVDLPAGIPVLVVDGDHRETGAYYLNSVFSPGRVATGIQPFVHPLDYLRDASNEELSKYSAIYILNVPRMDPRATANLERYVWAGGGLAFFAGPLSDPKYYTELYNNGQGLFPVPAAKRSSLVPEQADDIPDIQADDHAVFRALVDTGGRRRPFARDIRVSQYLEAPDDWTPPPDSTIQVLATLRNGKPLVVERQLGEGRVIAFLTTASPDWNNWALGPSYPVVLLQLHAYLAAPRQETVARTVGTPIDLQLDAARYRGDIEFLAPPAESGPVVVKKTASRPQPDSPILDFSFGRRAEHEGRSGETDRSGVYEARATTRDGEIEPRRYALNVAADEGDLSLVETSALTEKLTPVRVEVHEADELEYDAAAPTGFPWSQVLALVLLVLLLAEQALAYSASYHTPRRSAA